MLHHVSFNARVPEVVATGLAQLLRAHALRAPNPPFPAGSWFVCLGDEPGTLLEILPWGHVLDKNAPGGTTIDQLMRERTSTHVLLQTPLAPHQIERIAAEQGWDSSPADAGLFQFTKVWIGGRFLVELMSPEQAAVYTAAFGRKGIATLDEKLRDVERASVKSIA